MYFAMLKVHVCMRVYVCTEDVLSCEASCVIYTKILIISPCINPSPDINKSTLVLWLVHCHASMGEPHMVDVIFAVGWERQQALEVWCRDAMHGTPIFPPGLTHHKPAHSLRFVRQNLSVQLGERLALGTKVELPPNLFERNGYRTIHRLTSVSNHCSYFFLVQCQHHD